MPRTTPMQRTPPMHGFALIEVLFALAILGLGLSMAAGLQVHLQSQRQQLARETAMQLADNLAERMHLNANAISSYAQGWGAVAAQASTDCRQQPCSPSELAAWDVAQWRSDVQSLLPQGDAAVFVGDQGWWGILVAWQDAQTSFRTDTANGSPACPPERSCWRLWMRP